MKEIQWLLWSGLWVSVLGQWGLADLNWLVRTCLSGDVVFELLLNDRRKPTLQRSGWWQKFRSEMKSVLTLYLCSEFGEGIVGWSREKWVGPVPCWALAKAVTHQPEGWAVPLLFLALGNQRRSHHPSPWHVCLWAEIRQHRFPIQRWLEREQEAFTKPSAWCMLYVRLCLPLLSYGLPSKMSAYWRETDMVLFTTTSSVLKIMSER